MKRLGKVNGCNDTFEPGRTNALKRIVETLYRKTPSQTHRGIFWKDQMGFFNSSPRYFIDILKLMTHRELLGGNLSKNLQYNELLIKKPNELLQEQSHLVLFGVSPGVFEREFTVTWS
jgi:hypothetical protein